MTKSTPGKKRAREIQAETGKPYTACLRIALAEIAARHPQPEPEPAPDLEQPTSDGLFSHT